MLWPKPDVASMNAFYGNPDTDKNGLPDAVFESQNLTTITPPYPMFFSWNGLQVGKIRVHKKVSVTLLAALTQIGRDLSIAERQKFQLDRFGGGYAFRLRRGGNSLSIHSWGAAVDLAPALNPMGVEYGSRPNMIPMKAVKAFQAQGWKWGAAFKDCMHFEATA